MQNSVNSKVYIIEGSTACMQVLEIGDDISSMVQADDVRGTGSLDLIVTTASGEIVLLGLPDTVPYHHIHVQERMSIDVQLVQVYSFMNILDIIVMC